MQLDPQRCCCRKLGGDVSPISYPSRTRHATKTFVSGFVSGLESGSTFRNKFERDMPKNAKLRHPTCNSSNVADLNLLLVFPRLKAANTRFISFLYETSFHSKKLWKTFWKVDLRGHIFLPLGRFLPGLFSSGAERMGVYRNYTPLYTRTNRSWVTDIVIASVSKSIPRTTIWVSENSALSKNSTRPKSRPGRPPQRYLESLRPRLKRSKQLKTS